MASNKPEGFWSVKIIALPNTITACELSEALNISIKRVRIPTGQLSETYYAFVNDFASEKRAREFANQWSGSTVFGEAIQCTAIPPKTNISRDVISKESEPVVTKKYVLSPEVLTPEEKTYYSTCKQYYNLTKMPLVSIAPNILNDDFQTESLSFKFAIDEDYDKFDMETFLNNICNLLNINRDDIRVNKIQKGSVHICLDYVVKKIGNTATQIKMLIKSTYNTLTEKVKQEMSKLKVFFMYMGDITNCANVTQIRHEIKLYPQYNRIYAPGHTYWPGALQDGRDRGDSPYYCPVGWKRYSFNVCDNFDQKFKGWCICYHGTKFEYGLSILLSGLKPAWDTAHGPGIYASPSIIYAAHPRYAEVKEIQPSQHNDFFKHGRYVQFVLECRVHPTNRKVIGRETLGASNRIIDPNISNDKIEWVIDNRGNDLVDFNDPNASIICTGLMIRVTDNHPVFLPDSQWWGYDTANNGSCNIIYE